MCLINTNRIDAVFICDRPKIGHVQITAVQPLMDISLFDRDII